LESFEMVWGAMVAGFFGHAIGAFAFPDAGFCPRDHPGLPSSGLGSPLKLQKDRDQT
jgi:hypothetical protein